jgi:hypothetical protein
MSDVSRASEAAAAALLQTLTCAEVMAALPTASADEVAALCTRLADLLDETEDVCLDEAAGHGLACALVASPRVHAEHAGLQEAAVRILYWTFGYLPESSPEREAVFDLVFSAARTHMDVASLQCALWKGFSFCAELDFQGDESEDERRRYAELMQRASEPVLAALRAHMADARVVRECLECLRGLRDDVIVGASETIFAAYRTHGGDADSVRVVWNSLLTLLWKCAFEEEKDAPVVDAVYALVLPVLAAAQQEPEPRVYGALRVMTLLAERKYAGLDVSNALSVLLQVIRNADADADAGRLNCRGEALRGVEHLAAHPAAVPFSPEAVELLLCVLRSKANNGVLQGAACECVAAVVNSGGANAAVVAATDAFDAALALLETGTSVYAGAPRFAAELLSALLSLRTVKHTGTAAEAARRVVRAACAAIKARLPNLPTAPLESYTRACCNSCLECLLACAAQTGMAVDMGFMVEAAVSVLRGCDAEETLATACALLARVLSLQPVDARARAVDDGALLGLVRAMTTHADNARLQQHACMACKCLCAARPQSCAAAGVIEAVGAALRKHAGSSRIMCMCGASLLADLAGAVADTVAPAQWLASLAAVTAAMRALPGDEAVQKHSCAAVSKLAVLVDDEACRQEACDAVLDAIAASYPRMLPGGFAAVHATQRGIAEHKPLAATHASIMDSVADVITTGLDAETLSDELLGAVAVLCRHCRAIKHEVPSGHPAAEMPGVVALRLIRRLLESRHRYTLSVEAEEAVMTILEALSCLIAFSPYCRAAVQTGCVEAVVRLLHSLVQRFDSQHALHLGSVEERRHSRLRQRGLDALCMLLCEPGAELVPAEDACLRAEAAGVHALWRYATHHHARLATLWEGFKAAQAAKSEGVAAALVAAEEAEAATRDAAAQRSRDRNRKKKDKRRAAGGTTEDVDAVGDDVASGSAAIAAVADAAPAETRAPAVDAAAVVAALPVAEHAAATPAPPAVASEATPPAPPPLPPPALPLLPPLPASPPPAAPSAAPPRRVPPPYRPPPFASSSVTPAPLLNSQLFPMPPWPAAPAAVATPATDGIWAELLAASQAQLAASQAQLAASQAQLAVQAKLADDAAAGEARAAAALAKLEAEHSCVICLDAPRCMGLMPCRHLLLCDGVACAAMLGAPPLCPTCREPVADTMRLFV